MEEVKKLFPDYDIKYRFNEFDNQKFVIIYFSKLIPSEEDINNMKEEISKYFSLDSIIKYKIKKNHFLTPINIEIISWVLSILFVSGILVGFKVEDRYVKEN